ncbi:hypothetical protein M3D92_01240 [Micrococcus terreus]|uniref:hypothetical protein n=1 Tax=Micrococcus terreus TaxID=574650 RepID=UPI0021A6B00C|nr:hypothetical protein [Micrococcus terreus]MCT2087920.1 hypothetical protein [Micrococcus terreus]
MYDQIEEAVDGLVAALQDGTVEQIVQRHAVWGPAGRGSAPPHRKPTPLQGREFPGRG